MSGIDNVKGPTASTFTASERDSGKKKQSNNKSKHQPPKVIVYKEIIKEDVLQPMTYRKIIRKLSMNEQIDITNAFDPKEKTKKVKSSFSSPPKSKTKTSFSSTRPKAKTKPLYKSTHDISKGNSNNNVLAKQAQLNLQNIRKMHQPLASIKNHLGISHNTLIDIPIANPYNSFIQKRMDKMQTNSFTKRPKRFSRNVFAMLANRLSNFKMHNAFGMKLHKSQYSILKNNVLTTQQRTYITNRNILLEKIKKQRELPSISGKKPIIKTTKTPQELRTIADAVKASIHEKQKENQMKQEATKVKQDENQEQQKRNVSHQINMKNKNHADVALPKKHFLTHQTNKNHNNTSTSTTADKINPVKKKKEKTLKTYIDYIEEVTAKRIKVDIRKKQIHEQTLKQQNRLEDQLEQQIYEERLFNNSEKLAGIIAYEQQKDAKKQDWMLREIKKKVSAEKKFIKETIETNEVKRCTKGLTNNRIDRALEDFYFLDKKQLLNNIRHPDNNIDTQI